MSKENNDYKIKHYNLCEEVYFSHNSECAFILKKKNE